MHGKTLSFKDNIQKELMLSNLNLPTAINEYALTSKNKDKTQIQSDCLTPDKDHNEVIISRKKMSLNEAQQFKSSSSIGITT